MWPIEDKPWWKRWIFYGPCTMAVLAFGLLTERFGLQGCFMGFLVKPFFLSVRAVRGVTLGASMKSAPPSPHAQRASVAGMTNLAPSAESVAPRCAIPDDGPSVAGSSLSWLAALRVYARPQSVRMLALGFSAGLPLLLVLGTLSFWLREAGVDRTTIGYLSWVGLAYAFKWAWAPLVDRLPLPLLTRGLGRRRSWMLLSQCVIALALLGMAAHDPQQSLQPLVWCALAVAFASATQDIALDAWRIESAVVREQAVLAAAYQTGYRLGMIWAGAGVLWIAARAQALGVGSGAVGASATYAHGPWQVAYTAMAASMMVGIFTVLLSREPAGVPTLGTDITATVHTGGPFARLLRWLRAAVVDPFADFIRRWRWRALVLLALIGVYRISDVVMGIMANPFYVDMGFTKDEVAAVSKVFGLIMTLGGAFLGGLLAVRRGVMPVLMLGALLSSASNLLFAWLAGHGHDVRALVAVVSVDNLAGGLASAAFVAYLSGLTSVQYSATQYALLSSMMMLAPKWLAGFSGQFVDIYGYEIFFIATAVLGLPVLVLVLVAAKLQASLQENVEILNNS